MCKGLIVAAVGQGGWDMLGAVGIEVVPGVESRAMGIEIFTPFP